MLKKWLQLPGILTTDGNAASDETQFFSGRGAETHLDWTVLNCRKCLSPEYIRKKAAEVLIPDRVPPELIKQVCVRSITAQFELTVRGFDKSKLFEVEKLHGEVRVRPDLYF